MVRKKPTEISFPCFCGGVTTAVQKLLGGIRAGAVKNPQNLTKPLSKCSGHSGMQILKLS